jgi:hypothetical protein
MIAYVTFSAVALALSCALFLDYLDKRITHLVSIALKRRCSSCNTVKCVARLAAPSRSEASAKTERAV